MQFSYCKSVSGVRPPPGDKGAAKIKPVPSKEWPKPGTHCLERSFSGPAGLSLDHTCLMFISSFLDPFILSNTHWSTAICQEPCSAGNKSGLPPSLQRAFSMARRKRSHQITLLLTVITSGEAGEGITEGTRLRMGLGEEGLCREPHLGGDSRRRRN